jgi:2-hydroxychromene-2-carboxylate isomerase
MLENKNTITEETLPFKSEAPLIIYIDFKSPYAYLAVEPTRKMLLELGLTADWRPFVLDIPSYLGSASLDKEGKKVTKQNRTEEQWSGVKYAYFDCRRYANLSNKTIRGTVKIWSTDLPAIGMLWIKRFEELSEQCKKGSLLERYVDSIYEPFWRRELDVEDVSAILNVLKKIGAPIDGFLKYAKDEGASKNNQLQESAFNAGVYGVPTFILPNESVVDPQHEKFFGRENLPRISWLLSGRQGLPPDVAYQLASNVDEEILVKCASEPRSAPELVMSPQQLTTYFDFKSPQSYLSLQSIFELKEQGILINWQPFVSKPLRVPTTEVDDEDRSAKHYRLRGEYIANDLNRYAPHELIDIYKEIDCQFADMGLMWLQVELQVNSDTIDNYVLSVFNYLWRDGGKIDSSKDIEQLLVSMKHIQSEVNKVSEGLSIRDAWQRYIKTRGLKHLEMSRLRAQTASISAAPTFLIGSEPFQGRAQLPLITARLMAGI